VFGVNKCLWFFPLVLEEGRPCGDGVVFPGKNTGFKHGQENLLEMG